MPDLELQHLVLAGGDTAARLDPLTPDEPQLGVARQTPCTAQSDDRELRFVGRFELLSARSAQEFALGDRRYPAALEQRAQITIDEVPAAFEHLQALLAGDQLDRDLLGHALDVAVGVLGDRIGLGRRIQPQDEDLLLIGQLVAVGQVLDHGRAAGGKGKRCRLHQFAAVGLQPGLDLEGAAHAGRQIALEVEHPVLLVRPARAARLRTVDVERFGQARIAERDDGIRETRADLTHTLDLALRREEFHSGREPGCGKKKERSREAA